MSAILSGLDGAFVTVGLVSGLLGVLRRLERGFEYWWACAAAADFSWMIAAILNGVAWEAAMWAVFGASAVWSWWDHHRKNRGKRKAREAIGAKSRALRDALVRRARQVARPRPVLRPAPGGAR